MFPVASVVSNRTSLNWGNRSIADVQFFWNSKTVLLFTQFLLSYEQEFMNSWKIRVYRSFVFPSIECSWNEWVFSDRLSSYNYFQSQVVENYQFLEVSMFFLATFKPRQSQTDRSPSPGNFSGAVTFHIYCCWREYWRSHCLIMTVRSLRKAEITYEFFY